MAASTCVTDTIVNAPVLASASSSPDGGADRETRDDLELTVAIGVLLPGVDFAGDAKKVYSAARSAISATPR